MSIKEKLQQYASPTQTEAGEHSTPLAADEARKARTRRLIQVGAITDQYLETVGCAPEDVEQLLQELVQLPDVQHLLRRQSTQRKK